MNLQQLRYLVATADHGTMTAAARAVHVAQPVVTRAVRALERELGTPLLVRRGRRVHLTDDGLRAVEAARRALAEIAVLERLGSVPPVPTPVLELAATPSLQAELAAELLPAFRRVRPDCRVRITHCTSRAEVVAAVRTGEAELGLCDAPVPDDLATVRLGEREAVLLSPPGCGPPARVPLADLGEYELALPTPASPRRAEIESVLARAGVTLRAGMEADERTAWLQWVRAGLGSCLWPLRPGESEPPAGVTVRRLDPPVRWAFVVVHRPGALGEPAGPFVTAARRAREDVAATGADGPI